MYPVITIGQLTIPSYGLMAVLGFTAAFFIYLYQARKYGIQRCDVLYSSVYCIVGLFVGAKFLYFMISLPAVIAHSEVIVSYPVQTLSFLFGGYVFYGGLAGAVAGIYIYCRKFQLKFSLFANAAAPAMPLMHGLGRIGCFLAGCCYGREYHGAFAVHYPLTGPTAQLNGTPRIPTQLMESGFDFILFAVLIGYQKTTKKAYRPIGIYLTSYSVVRFCIEFLRGDVVRGGLNHISTSQWISLGLLPIGILLWIGRKEKKENAAVRA